VQLRRLWLYALARYGSYDVFWNLFDRDNTPLPSDVEAQVAAFAQLTQRYDPYDHPVTAVTTNPTSAPAAAPTPPTGEPPPARSSRGNRTPQPPPDPGTPLAGEKWLDVVTLAGGDLNGITRDWQFNKPVIVRDDLAAASSKANDTPDAARKRMWE